MKNLNELKVLVTGAGGPAAICAFKSLNKTGMDIHMADMDGLSAGLYLTAASNRHIIPGGVEASFVPTVLQICKDNHIDILIPTVDCELIKIAERKEEFENAGIQLLLAKESVLNNIMNKHTLLDSLKENVEVGSFDMLRNTNAKDWVGKKIVVKPVSGSGSRGVEFYDDYSQIPSIKFEDHKLMIQEFATGPEYSVDVMVSEDGEIKAAVPRLRMRTDSGVSVTGKVERKQEVIDYVESIINTLGLTSVANIQVIDSPVHGPRLIEINPRFSGGLSLVIESGADTPVMAIQDLIGNEVAKVEDFREIAMVRTFTETYLDSKELKN